MNRESVIKSLVSKSTEELIQWLDWSKDLDSYLKQYHTTMGTEPIQTEHRLVYVVLGILAERGVDYEY